MMTTSAEPTAALAPELQLVPRGVCEVCGEPTDTPPECGSCYQRADDAARRRERAL